MTSRASEDTIPQDTVPRDTIRTAPDTIRTHFNSLERDLVGNGLLSDAFPAAERALELDR